MPLSLECKCYSQPSSSSSRATIFHTGSYRDAQCFQEEEKHPLRVARLSTLYGLRYRLKITVLFHSYLPDRG